MDEFEYPEYIFLSVASFQCQMTIWKDTQILDLTVYASTLCFITGS